MTEVQARAYFGVVPDSELAAVSGFVDGVLRDFPSSEFGILHMSWEPDGTDALFFTIDFRAATAMEAEATAERAITTLSRMLGGKKSGTRRTLNRQETQLQPA